LITRLLDTCLRTRYGFVAALLLMFMNEATHPHSSQRLTFCAAMNKTG